MRNNTMSTSLAPLYVRVHLSASVYTNSWNDDFLRLMFCLHLSETWYACAVMRNGVYIACVLQRRPSEQCRLESSVILHRPTHWGYLAGVTNNGGPCIYRIFLFSFLYLQTKKRKMNSFFVFCFQICERNTKNEFLYRFQKWIKKNEKRISLSFFVFAFRKLRPHNYFG